MILTNPKYPGIELYVIVHRCGTLTCSFYSTIVAADTFKEIFDKFEYEYKNNQCRPSGVVVDVDTVNKEITIDRWGND